MFESSQSMFAYWRRKSGAYLHLLYGCVSIFIGDKKKITLH